MYDQYGWSQDWSQLQHLPFSTTYAKIHPSILHPPFRLPPHPISPPFSIFLILILHTKKIDTNEVRKQTSDCDRFIHLRQTKGKQGRSRGLHFYFILSPSHKSTFNFLSLSFSVAFPCPDLLFFSSVSIYKHMASDAVERSFYHHRHHHPLINPPFHTVLFYRPFLGATVQRFAHTVSWKKY